MPEANLNSDDFYKILGIEKGASEKEIKMAYRKAALKWHPDKNADNKEKAEENFKKITEAYEVLSDKDKRQTYDRFGKQAVSGNGAGGPGGFSSGGGMTSAHADEIFKAFFGGGDPFGGDDPFAGMMGGMGGPGGGSFVFNMGGPGGGGVQFGGPGGMGGGMGGMGGGHPFGGMMGGMGGGHPFGGMGGGMQQPKRRRVERCDLIPDQQKVTIMGLQSRSELNDTTGVVVDFNEQSGRYVVKTNIAATGGQGEQLSLKPDNLTLRVEKAKFVDIQAKPELNETEAMVIKYDTAKDRYQILSKKTNGVMSVSVGNVALPVGTRVMMFGLTGSPQYNGKWGKITETCMGERKYLVQVGQNKNIKIKFSACRCSG